MVRLSRPGPILVSTAGASGNALNALPPDVLWRRTAVLAPRGGLSSQGTRTVHPSYRPGWGLQQRLTVSLNPPGEIFRDGMRPNQLPTSNPDLLAAVDAVDNAGSQFVSSYSPGSGLAATIATGEGAFVYGSYFPGGINVSQYPVRGISSFPAAPSRSAG